MGIPEYRHTFHTKFVLNRNRDETGSITKYKEQMVECVNVECETPENILSPMAEFPAAKLIT